MLSPSPAPVLDCPEGIRRVRGDEKLYKELVDVFLRDVPRLLKLIDSAVAQRSLAELRCAAHSLKGSSSQIGARAVAQRAAALEQMAKVNAIDGIEEQCRLLREDLQTLTQVVRAERNPA